MKYIAFKGDIKEQYYDTETRILTYKNKPGVITQCTEYFYPDLNSSIWQLDIDLPRNRNARHRYTITLDQIDTIGIPDHTISCTFFPSDLNALINRIEQHNFRVFQTNNTSPINIEVLRIKKDGANNNIREYDANSKILIHKDQLFDLIKILMQFHLELLENKFK